MSIIGWIVLGLIAGAIAKAILPGRQSGGWLVTLLLGIVGALLGGFLGSALFGVTLGSFFEIRTWLLAIGGALIVLLIWGFATRRPHASNGLVTSSLTAVRHRRAAVLRSWRPETSQTRRRSVAHRVSWWRLESWSLRSTLETWVSTVLIEMNSSRAISLYA
jgi:uncharacterized membrane protein YeaQ/YmgE (transglycosylase-associated protein family)